MMEPRFLSSMQKKQSLNDLKIAMQHVVKESRTHLVTSFSFGKKLLCESCSDLLLGV